MQEVVFSPADFVASLNQTFEFAYPGVSIVGELANLRVSKSKWVYFDLKDEYASVKFFGTVYQLPGPLEDGLMVQVKGVPRLHPQYGFSVGVQSMRPVGDGSLRRAATLLESKLVAEGLFDAGRKRLLPFPPQRVGLITSGESAAYGDFVKIINTRWGGIEVVLADVQVQGEPAPGQIVRAIEYFNSHAEPVDVLVIIRGGGSAEDLGAFSTEQVTRAVAGSRIPTLAAIGHEVDVTLAELAADLRASTPSNAAEMLVPDKAEIIERLPQTQAVMTRTVEELLSEKRRERTDYTSLLNDTMTRQLDAISTRLDLKKHLLAAFNPASALTRGYAILRQGGKLIRSGAQLKKDMIIDIELQDAKSIAQISSVKIK